MVTTLLSPVSRQSDIGSLSLKAALGRVLRTCSRNQAAELFRNGRISADVWIAYCRVSEWISPLFGSLKQDAFWNRYGKEAYYRKIAKTRAAFGFDPLRR